MNFLLQVLDDGIVTSGLGTQVNFKYTLIILTSNLGSQFLLESHSDEKAKSLVLTEVRKHFRPELLNRLDDMIVFHHLKQEQLTQIVDIQLEQVKALLQAKNLSMVVEPKAKELLAERGYDPIYGARPLKRLITDLILNPLSIKLLEGEFRSGDQVEIKVSSKGELDFSKK
jgi:ATP-dependent Clp protease ATP-binding subunit ClpB